MLQACGGSAGVVRRSRKVAQARREAKKANKLTFKEEMKLQKKRSQAGDGQTVFFM